jgi:hypothetical protein
MTIKYSPIDVIASLLTFFKSTEFSNDPEIIHRTIAHLKQNPKYKDLLGEFEFIDYDTYPYSPLLGRTLNRLQESRLLASLNPSYEKYVLNKETKDAIIERILNVKMVDQKDNLREMAEELENSLP